MVFLLVPRDFLSPLCAFNEHLKYESKRKTLSSSTSWMELICDDVSGLISQCLMLFHSHKCTKQLR